MRSAHSVEQVRAAERPLLDSLPEGALMQRAAAGLATAIADFVGQVYGARVLLLVGAGDNGGDALFAGAMLARRGAQVSALLLAEQVHEAGLAALLTAGGVRRTAPTDGSCYGSHVSVGGKRPDVVVDGIVGIGGRPGLRDNAVAALEALDGVPVVAVDVPSGVDVDGGRIDGSHVRADLTVTFGTLKPAHLVDPAASACGVVELVDIGLSLPEAGIEALQAADVRALLQTPDPSAHKYSRGVVGLRTGSAEYPGAAVLGASGAVGLCGMVRYVGSAAEAVLAAHPEVVVGEGRVQAWVVGSGGGEGSAAALDRAVADGVPVVVDADALVHARPGGRQVLTPHAGELARMLGERRESIEAEPLRWVRAAASSYECVVLLKGRRTLVAHPDGRVRVNTTGTPWLASAGSGDVLAGVVGALLAVGLDPFDAASVGAWLHGCAAQLIAGPVQASELGDAIRLLLESSRRNG